MKFGTLVALSSVCAFVAGAGGYTVFPAVMASAAGRSCLIKGNISIGSGERIYHVPGQHYYAATKVSPQYGERWFCSESEARAAGWRKAGF
jgi:hypothetical protein